MSSGASIPASERSGLRRFLTIVLAIFGGSVGCWVWACVLLALVPRPDDYGGPAPTEAGARVAWTLTRCAWWAIVGGGSCGLFFVFPALACLWSRRLFPALVFVLAVGYGTATGAMLAPVFGGEFLAIELAAPLTAAAVLGALVFVRVVPLRIWTLECRPSA